MSDVGDGGTALVVEDSDDVRESVRDGLQQRGFRVLVARDGLKALTILASTPVDVIVLDLSMPIMSGWEFLDARSADPTLATIPVVVLSGVAWGVEGTWNAMVPKPFALDALVAAIERCRRPSLPAELPRH